MRALTEATLDDAVASARHLVVDFWAPWCRPCDVIEPVLADLAARYAGVVEFARLDVDANPGAGARFGILALPTVIVFAGGDAVVKLLGARPRSDYERALREVIPAAELDRLAAEE